MSVDKLQEMIRKLKNPSVVELNLTPEQMPGHLIKEEGSFPRAYGRFCTEMLSALKGIVPAVRFSWSHFSLLDCLHVLKEYVAYASQMGYYTIVDAPETISPDAARLTAKVMLSLPCDGIVLSAGIGSDALKPYVSCLKESGKALFVVLRTGNKSAGELQDLMTGSRLVHIAVADIVKLHAENFPTRSGYYQIGGLAPANSAASLRSLRSKYSGMFLLLDGYDYPSANAKICSLAFDKLGHGAVASAGASVTAAWMTGDDEGRDYLAQSVAAAERMQRNLTRYVTIL